MSEQITAEQIINELIPKLTDSLRSLPQDTHKAQIKQKIDSGEGFCPA